MNERTAPEVQTNPNLLASHPHHNTPKPQDCTLNSDLPTAAGGAPSAVTGIPVVAAPAAPVALVDVADAATAAKGRHDVGAPGAAVGAVDAREAGATLAPVGGAGALLKREGLHVAAGLDGEVVARVALRRGGEEGDGEEEDAELHFWFWLVV